MKLRAALRVLSYVKMSDAEEKAADKDTPEREEKPKPARAKIPEGVDQLRAREAWFRKRSGGGASGDAAGKGPR